jgi:O-phospho-L-seryl-tRNASec:L-selenocysteinyl-tRNA synthase
MHHDDPDPFLSALAPLCPEGHLSRAIDGRRSQRRRLAAILSSGTLPETGLSDGDVRQLLAELASLDSNDRAGTAGCGEREGRVFSSLVRERSFGLAHGVGRSGDVAAPQPKAAGSSILGSWREKKKKK